jgi:hypothetical protein
VPTKARKTWAQQLQQNHSVAIAMSCAIVGLSRCAYYYQPELLDDSVIVSVLNAITDRHLRRGFLNALIVPIAELLDLSLFNNLVQARKIIEEGLTIYNT